jgi:hypothetical protein
MKSLIPNLRAMQKEGNIIDINLKNYWQYHQYLSVSDSIYLRHKLNLLERLACQCYLEREISDSCG